MNDESYPGLPGMIEAAPLPPPTPLPANVIARQGEVSEQTVSEGPPTHVIWRENSAELVHPQNYSLDNPNLEELPEGFHDRPMLADPATRTFAPDFDLVKTQKLRAISDERDRRIEQFHAFQKAIPLNDKTQALLSGAALGLMRNTQVTEIAWSLGGGEFLHLPRDVVLNLADGGFLYVQNLFAKHGALAARVTAAYAAKNIDDLEAINVNDDSNWT